MKADKLVLKTVIQLVKKYEDDDSTGPKKLDYNSLSNSISWYCMLCDVSFGAWAVSRETRIYFILDANFI